MALQIPFENTYVRLPDRLFTRTHPVPVKAPELLAFNHPLARDLGISGDDDIEALARVFGGNEIPDGADPLAQLYAAHQFGHWNPQLGDGRAVLLGEVKGRDLQLKGSGRTPYSRNGDGRAWVGPVLREFVVSEAMHALGIPTTRALAAVATGETIQRETTLPGAVLTRVASSHIRVGTFQALAARQDQAGLQALFDYACERHYPDVSDPLGFLKAVIARQASLVSQWMSVGFIHGVMNTDNCAISGETIDYGPCAFMDAYHPMTVFSSIDRTGRYAFGAQADIIVWNMAQLATALVPLMPDSDLAVEEFTKAIHAMPDLLQEQWSQTLLRKIGIRNARKDDSELSASLLQMMTDQGADFTNTFAALGTDTAQDQFVDRDAFESWARTWRNRIEAEDDPYGVMRATNPVLIPRNHRIEQMIQAAVTGDMAPFSRLMQALSAPFDDTLEFADLRRPPLENERVRATFCGT
ncbi:YdiU family protein [Shimia thalassica]|uniref:protein adenylyltransferase SelO n=1 Tax=Shimia thalassica TaxID=1715693 RepID=UPI001C099DA7|nr:YdiU family protein [Shimia thalassica]MBU2941649.1 YdiU family protein [Shimia thalassica]MDO6503970.1 YdiU family protein [Shimia thalassica]